MRLKAKNQAEQAIEKFILQSSKSAKYAKTIVKKREASASQEPSRANDLISAAGGHPVGSASSQSKPPVNPSNDSSQAVG